MREGDDAFEALREAIERLAAQDAPDVITEARADARTKVRTILADAIADALLERAGGALGPAPETHATGELGRYVFGVVRAGALDPPAGTQLLTEGDLAAVVRRVPLSEYGEQALRENLSDNAWLEDAARRHEAVLDDLRTTTVIPLRLCTIYRNAQAVREMLADQRATLDEALRRLAGRTEWAVKAFCGAATVAVDAKVEDAHARLAALAEEALANPLQRRELTGRGDQMVLNGVYLVDDAREAAFRAAVQELGAPGLTFELTGPGPPHSFVPAPTW